MVETTRCSVSQAEIALYDNNNDVQEAVNAILEDNYPDENVWKEQKSRRAKRAEAEELKNEESNSSHRNRINNARPSSNFGRVLASVGTESYCLDSLYELVTSGNAVVVGK